MAASEPAGDMEARPRLAEDLLPPVLWQMILEYSDNTELWTQCRQVCSLFREIGEHDFKFRVLRREMTIEIDLDWDYVDQENLARKTFFGFQMEFDRFEKPDQDVAVFAKAKHSRLEDGDSQDTDDEDEAEDEEAKEEGDAADVAADKESNASTVEKEAESPKELGEGPLVARKFQRIAERMEREKLEEKFSIYTPSDATGATAMDSRFDLPPWTIEIAGQVNDTELPGWRFDYAKQELSFRWKDAMEAFFRESHGMRQEARRLITSPEFKFRETELRAKYPIDSDDTEVHVQRTLSFYQMITREETKARRKMRRHRLMKFWAQNHALDPDKDSYKIEGFLDNDPVSETLALKKMRQMEMDEMWLR